MDKINLISPNMDLEKKITEYRDSFPADRMRVTYDPDRIPGLDCLEDFNTVSEWISFCETEKDRISFFLAVRPDDEKIVGACSLRHSLEYDDDDPEFASHIGYSVRPDERRKGYASEILRLVLHKAKSMGLPSVRIICRDINEGSRRTILANGGVYIDSITGDESGITVNRYDVPTL